MSDFIISIISVIVGAYIGFVIGKKNIIFQEYRQIVIEFRNILITIYHSINGLEYDKHLDASKFIVDKIIETDLIFDKLIFTDRNIRRKRNIANAYNDYKKPYEIAPEKAKPFIQFDPDWKTKEYQKQYRCKNIPDGINLANKNIENLIDIISCHNIFSLFCCYKNKT
ncbi:hypothetical protein KKA87_10980 [bacterium]|nr:hypothetical protein [bacterium]